MYKATVDIEKKIVIIQNYNDPNGEEKIYKDADLKFFYPEQLIELHVYGGETTESSDTLTAILPLGLTFTEWVNRPQRNKRKAKQ